MLEKVKNFSKNCQGCGAEKLNYQIRSVKLGYKLVDVCTECQKNFGVIDDFKKAVKILNEICKESQVNENPALLSPNIVVEPVTPMVQKATELLKRMDPNYFVGVSKIRINPGASYGHVKSGPGEDPTVVNLNFNRILQEAGGPNANPKNIIINTAITIAHEIGHIRSFDDEQGFLGGESPAMNEEQIVGQWIENNENIINNIIK